MLGQVSADFLVVCVVLAILFSVTYSLYLQESAAQLAFQERVSAQRAAERVALAANFVLSDGNGSRATVYLEPLATGQNYSLEFMPRRVQVAWPLSSSNSTASYPLLTSSVLGAGVKYAGQNLTLSNDGGALHVS